MVIHTNSEVPSATARCAPLPPSRSFAGAFASTLVGNLCAQGLGVAAGIMSARILGSTGRGELASVYFYPGIVAQFGIMSLEQAVCYEVCRKPSDEAAVVRSAFWLGLLIALPQALLATWLLPLLVPPDKGHLLRHMRWFMAYVTVVIPSLTLLQADFGALRYRRYNLLKVLPAAGYLIGMFAFWELRLAGVVAFAASALGAHVLTLLVRVCLAGRSLVSAIPDPSEMKRLMRLALRFHLPQVACILLSKADMALIVPLLPSREVGLYVVALAVALGQGAATSAFVQVAFVKAASAVDRESARGTLAVQFGVAKIGSLVIGTVFFVAAPSLIRHVFGPEFAPAVKLARWLVAAQAVMGLAQVLDANLRALGRAWIAALAYALALAVVVPGGLYYVPRHGLQAMGVLMLIASTVVLAVDTVTLAFFENVRLWRFDFRMYAPALAALTRPRSSVRQYRPGGDGNG